MGALDRMRTERRPDAVRGVVLDDVQRAPGEHLRAVHAMYRAELDHLVRVTDTVEAGVGQLVDLRQAIHDLALRRQLETYGSMCGRMCQLLVTHHTIEDRHMFPAVRAAATEYEPVVDQLEHEHVVIHELLVELDAAVVDAMSGTGALADVVHRVRELSEALRSHFTYEEEQLTEPLGLHDLLV